MLLSVGSNLKYIYTYLDIHLPIAINLPICEIYARIYYSAYRTALPSENLGDEIARDVPHSSLVFSKRKLQKLCVGRWEPVSM